MSKPLFSAAAASLIALAACTPPEPVPPPRFTPNPPNAPTPVDPYGNPVEPQTGQTDPNAPAPMSPPPETKPGDYPTARPTGKPNIVLSPYEPFPEVDVSDCSPGQLARDPYNRKIFRVP